MRGTEYNAEALKAFLMNGFTQYLEKYKDENTPMNKIDTVVFGGVDLSRYEKKKVVCAVIADNDTLEDPTIMDGSIVSVFTVGFILRGYPAEVLQRQMMRYAMALREAVIDCFTLNGKVRDCACGKCDYYPDAGTVEKQMCAAEIEMTITVDNEYPNEFA